MQVSIAKFFTRCNFKVKDTRVLFFFLTSWTLCCSLLSFDLMLPVLRLNETIGLGGKAVVNLVSNNKTLGPLCHLYRLEHQPSLVKAAALSLLITVSV